MTAAEKRRDEQCQAFLEQYVITPERRELPSPPDRSGTLKPEYQTDEPIDLVLNLGDVEDALDDAIQAEAWEYLAQVCNTAREAKNATYAATALDRDDNPSRASYVYSSTPITDNTSRKRHAVTPHPSTEFTRKKSRLTNRTRRASSILQKRALLQQQK